MQAQRRDSIGLATLLQEMTQYRSVCEWPSPAYTEWQASSYDRRSIAPDQPGWFANTDQNQFIRTEQHDGREEAVMMEAEGPGVVVRFWLTTQSKSGRIRFYLDGAAVPVLDIPAYDLMKAGLDLGPALLQPHSSYEPEGKGGNTLYLPVPYQKHCKITFEFTDSLARKSPHYYQVNYRSYASGTAVKTLSRAELERNRKLVDATEERLKAPVTSKGKEKKENFTLQPAQAHSINLPAGNQAISKLNIQLLAAGKPAPEAAYRSTWIAITFDGKETVHCPLGDFAGSGYGRNLVKSWYRDMQPDGRLTSRWLMPYKKSASVQLISNGGQPLEVSFSATTSAYAWNDRSLYFHVTHKQEDSVWDAKWDYDVNKVAMNDSKAPLEWNFIGVKGKGIYVGNTLAVNNLMKTWYGEGDAKVYVDGSRFPVEFGTGLEDYYNTSWAPVVLYQTPFANAPRADQESSFGHNTFTRTRNLDAIPFEKNFRYDLEMLSWDGGYANVAATIYWYGAADAVLE